MTSQVPGSKESVYETLDKIRHDISQIFIGQDQVVEQILIAMIAGGHALIEGVPGLGKTLLVKTLSKVFSADYSRIQFTPDLMPADVTGHMIFDKNTGQFITHKGPVFTNFLLADEINRAPAKTQAALLEVMEEKQVTLEGQALLTPEPFMVLATQNPIEQEGTYPLPEAQLDRFLLKIFINYPAEEHELTMLESITSKPAVHNMNELTTSALTLDKLIQCQQMAHEVLVDSAVYHYVLQIVRLTRNWNSIAVGAGPRGGIAIIKCAKARALLHGRDFVLPEDVKHISLAALRHRLILSPEYELAGQDADSVLVTLLDKVQAPRT